MKRPIPPTSTILGAPRLALFVSTLALGGCGSAPTEDGLGSRSTESVVASGIDYAWGHPSPASIRAEGYTFAARYLSYDTTGKTLTGGEADALRAAGVDVVVVWETSASRATSGFDGGVADAQEAQRQAEGDGMPAGRPIYFAIDFDASSGDQPALDAYFDGVASVLGRDRTGAYGGYGPISRLFDGGKIRFGWQTYAWSGGRWDGRAQLRQVLNDISVGGNSGCCDLDEAVSGDYGQWSFRSAPPRPTQTAFQANTTSLWTVGSAGNRDWGLGMMAGTSPSITALAGGGFEVAFQANTGSLWTVGDAGNSDWGLGMMAGTSPSITALAGGGFEVAFQANTGNLWTVGAAGNLDWKLGMMKGTSPSITGLDTGGFQVAFQANTGSLWTVGDAGWNDWRQGLHTSSSPSITGLPGGSFQVAFEANTGNLFTAGSLGVTDWGLGMYPGSSPSITALDGGKIQIAFQANTTSLWTVGDAGWNDWGLGMMPGTSPSISPLPNGGFRATFEANTTSLWSAGTDGVVDMKLGMMNGTSPSGT